MDDQLGRPAGRIPDGRYRQLRVKTETFLGIAPVTVVSQVIGTACAIDVVRVATVSLERILRPLTRFKGSDDARLRPPNSVRGA
jgi:hypothetical protein